MNRILFAILFCLFIVSAQEKQQLTSPAETLVLLEEIKPEAIVIGKGPKEIHSFIDPYCSMSQMYMKHLFKNKKRMESKYTVYLYFYELKRKKSGLMIENIYDAEDQLFMIKQVMVENQKIDVEEVGDLDIDEKIAKIAARAEKIGVYKRPFIITNGKAK